MSDDFLTICNNDCEPSILRYYYDGSMLSGHIDLIPDDFGFYKVVNDRGEEVEAWIESLDLALIIWARLKRLTTCPIGRPQWRPAQ